MSKFFTYSQNNSGGVYYGPAQYVIIEADNADNADDIAREHDIYFNGCATGMDCSCCGDRWSHQWEEGTDSPEIYGKAPDEFDFMWDCPDGVPNYIIIHNDGKVTGKL